MSEQTLKGPAGSRNTGSVHMCHFLPFFIYFFFATPSRNQTLSRPGQCRASRRCCRPFALFPAACGLQPSNLPLRSVSYASSSPQTAAGWNDSPTSEPKRCLFLVLMPAASTITAVTDAGSNVAWWLHANNTQACGWLHDFRSGDHFMESSYMLCCGAR